MKLLKSERQHTKVGEGQDELKKLACCRDRQHVAQFESRQIQLKIVWHLEEE